MAVYMTSGSVSIEDYCQIMASKKSSRRMTHVSSAAVGRLESVLQQRLATIPLGL